MTPSELEQRRRILFTMLTALDFRYPAGREPALVLGLRHWLGGWPGIGRIVAGGAAGGVGGVEEAGRRGGLSHPAVDRPDDPA